MSASSSWRLELRNFLKLCEGLNTQPLLVELAAQPELWNQFTVRTAHSESAHREVDDIVLRYSPYRVGEDYVDKVCASIDVVDYPPWYALPAAHPFIFGLMGRVCGLHLGRVMITRLPPGRVIPLHTDRIEPAEEAFPDRRPPAAYYERYHVVLQSGPGVVFECGGEAVYMAPGECWWFNNQLLHSVTNNGADDRLHLICDIRTAHDKYDPRGDAPW
jgi:hypothetical protein